MVKVFDLWAVVGGSAATSFSSGTEMSITLRAIVSCSLSAGLVPAAHDSSVFARK
jgi:hypothetical protein